MSEFTASQVFIVTGANSGLGKEVALRLNESGAAVVGIARNEKRLLDVKSECRHPDNFFIEAKDLTADIESLPDYVKGLKDKYGKFRGLAYCAGIVLRQPLQVLNFEDTGKIILTDYLAPMFFAKGFADRRVNAGEGSSAVFVSSIAAISSPKGMSAYVGAKAALNASVKSVARELAPRRVRFNTVSPSDFGTGMQGTDAKLFAEREAQYPFGFGEVSDIVNAVMFLLSDKSKWITGQNYILDCASY